MGNEEIGVLSLGMIIFALVRALLLFIIRDVIVSEFENIGGVDSTVTLYTY